MKEDLKANDKIKALKDLRGVSNSYNTPEYIDIPKGTILQVPKSGTRMGDVFCTVLSGEPILHSRADDTKVVVIPLHPSKPVGLEEGHTSPCPYSLGAIDTDQWELFRLNEPTEIQKRLDDLYSQQNDLSEQKESLEREVDELEDELENIDIKISELTKKLKDAEENS